MISWKIALVALPLFPVIYFFGIRNNPFAYLLSIPYSTFNYYHGFCASVYTALAFIHSVVWTILAVSQGTYDIRVKKEYWRRGIVSTTLFFILILHSEKILKKRIYEFFLVFYKAMNIILFIAVYYHIKNYGWTEWIWSMVAIYEFDRYMRLARIVLRGGVVNSTLKDRGDGVNKMILKKHKYLSYRTSDYAVVYFLSSTSAFFLQFSVSFFYRTF